VVEPCIVLHRAVSFAVLRGEVGGCLSANYLPCCCVGLRVVVDLSSVLVEWLLLPKQASTSLYQYEALAACSRRGVQILGHTS
jgi:hypothetical protein